MEERVVMEFEGGYGRDGKIYIPNGMCTICSVEKSVISSDGFQRANMASETYLLP